MWEERKPADAMVPCFPFKVTDTNNIQSSSHLKQRAVSLSSIASSSAAATSIMGELSGSSLNDDDSIHNQSSMKGTEVDRYGFTGGSQYTDPTSVILSVEKLRHREQKWLSMLNNWNKWMARRFPQVKNRCRKGIPPSLRGRAWQLLSGSKYLYERNQGKYEEFLLKEADPSCIDDIEKDLHRQFPFHEMFVEKGGMGQQDLRDVLRAYSVYNPEDGYCQAQAPIAAALLMHMPAEQAFWCMVAMCEHYLQGYFSPGLEAIQVDGYVMQSLLRKVSPVAHKHLGKTQVSPVLYMTEWFMCVFSRTLPWTSVLRVWDMFFCEGIKVVFRCALVLLRNTLGSVDKVKKLSGLYETMESLRHIDPSYLREDRLMFEIVNLEINEQDLEHEHKIQKIKWKKDRSLAPPILDSGKLGKRVYRYTPTYPQTESTLKHGGKSKIKNISTIGANSSLIIEQTRPTEKPRNRQKKTKHKGKTVMPDVYYQPKTTPTVETSFQTDSDIGSKPQASSFQTDSDIGSKPQTLKLAAESSSQSPQIRRRSAVGEPVVTSFAKTLLSSNIYRSNEDIGNESEHKPILTTFKQLSVGAPDGENQVDEITVF